MLYFYSTLEWSSLLHPKLYTDDVQFLYHPRAMFLGNGVNNEICTLGLFRTFYHFMSKVIFLREPPSIIYLQSL